MAGTEVPVQHSSFLVATRILTLTPNSASTMAIRAFPCQALPCGMAPATVEVEEAVATSLPTRVTAVAAQPSTVSVVEAVGVVPRAALPASARS